MKTIKAFLSKEGRLYSSAEEARIQTLSDIISKYGYNGGYFCRITVARNWEKIDAEYRKWLNES